MRSWPQTTFSALALFIGIVLLATPAMAGGQDVCPDGFCTGPENPSNCPADCPTLCGDGTLDPGEQCDDGNTTSGDCCSSTCQFEYLTVCRPAAGTCDLAETCPIASATCPADAKRTSVCRAAAGDCDVAESCNGVSNSCPSNTLKPNGTSCNDGDVCTSPDECQSGSCVGGAVTCGNGTVETSCGEECDDGNTQDGDGCSADCLAEGGGIPVLPESALMLFAVLLIGTSLLMLRHRLRSRI